MHDRCSATQSSEELVEPVDERPRQPRRVDRLLALGVGIVDQLVATLRLAVALQMCCLHLAPQLAVAHVLAPRAPAHDRAPQQPLAHDAPREALLEAVGLCLELRHAPHPLLLREPVGRVGGRAVILQLARQLGALLCARGTGAGR
eukprot:2765845-Prymnesium_polylepis.1